VTTPISQLLAGHPIFADLGEEIITTVVGCSRLVAFAEGALLVREGEPANTFYLVRRGRVSIEVHEARRGPLVIETVGPGSLVGWSWLVPPYRWTFDARALEPVGAIAVDGACLRAKAAADPVLGFALLGRVSQELLARLQATRVRLLDLYASPHE